MIQKQVHIIVKPSQLLKLNSINNRYHKASGKIQLIDKIKVTWNKNKCVLQTALENLSNLSCKHCNGFSIEYFAP